MSSFNPQSAIRNPQSGAALDVVALLLVSGWLVLANLWEPNLAEPDEPRSALIARIMAERGDWLVPHLPILFHHEHPPPPIEGGLRVYLYKPPLFFWLAALAMKGFGPTAFAARLPSALSYVATVLLVYFAGVGLGGRAVGLVAAGLYAVAPMPIVLGRLARLEATLVVFLAASMVAALRLLSGDAKSWRWAMVLAVAAALGALTKSPFMVGIPLVAAAVTLAPSGRGGLLARFHPVAGAALCLLLTAPWFLYMHGRYPPAAEGGVGGFTQEFFLRQHLARVTSGELGRSKPPGFQLVALLVGFLPWSAFLPGACVRWFPRAWRERRERPELLFLFAWILLNLAIFSLSRTQLAHYIAPALPAVALVAGLHVAERLRTAASRPERGFRAELAAVMALEAAGLAAVAAGLAREGLWRWAYLAPLGTIAATVAAAALLVLRKPRALRAALGLAVAAMALTVAFFAMSDPFRVYERRSACADARFLAENRRPGDGAIAYPSIPFSYAWAAWPRPVACKERLEDLVAELNREQRTLVFSRQTDVVSALRGRVRWPIEVLAETGNGVIFATEPSGAKPPHEKEPSSPRAPGGGRP